jgi:hypothetical protein
MTFQGNLIHASIEEAINPRSILGRAINRGSILEQRNKFESYCGKAINHEINFEGRSKINGRFLTIGWS